MSVLPEPVLEHIFRYLSTEDVCNCRLVCTSWYSAARYRSEIRVHDYQPSMGTPPEWTSLRMSIFDSCMDNLFNVLCDLGPQISELHLHRCVLPQYKLNILLQKLPNLSSLTLAVSQSYTDDYLPMSPQPHETLTLPRLKRLAVTIGGRYYMTLIGGAWPLQLDRMPSLRSISIEYVEKSYFDKPWIRWIKDVGALVHRLVFANCHIKVSDFYCILRSVPNLRHLTLQDIYWENLKRKNIVIPPKHYAPRLYEEDYGEDYDVYLNPGNFDPDLYPDGKYHLPDIYPELPGFYPPTRLETLQVFTYHTSRRYIRLEEDRENYFIENTKHACRMMVCLIRASFDSLQRLRLNRIYFDAVMYEGVKDKRIMSRLNTLDIIPFINQMKEDEPTEFYSRIQLNRIFKFCPNLEILMLPLQYTPFLLGQLESLFLYKYRRLWVGDKSYKWDDEPTHYRRERLDDGEMSITKTKKFNHFISLPKTMEWKSFFGTNGTIAQFNKLIQTDFPLHPILQMNY